MTCLDERAGLRPAKLVAVLVQPAGHGFPLQAKRKREEGALDAERAFSFIDELQA